MRSLLSAVACAVLLAVMPPAHADGGFHEPWIAVGSVRSVADGDTMHVATRSQGEVIVRLAGIDAPERGQAYWRTARSFVLQATAGKDVTIGCHKRDRYGREICRVWVDSVDLPAALLAAGLAWHYREFLREQTPEERATYARLEDEARAARRGLWREPDPQPPAECRKGRREQLPCR